MFKKLFWQENPNGLKISSQWFQSVITIVAVNYCNNNIDTIKSFAILIVMKFRNLRNIQLFSRFSMAILLKVKVFIRWKTDILALCFWLVYVENKGFIQFCIK